MSIVTAPPATHRREACGARLAATALRALPIGVAVFVGVACAALAFDAGATASGSTIVNTANATFVRPPLMTSGNVSSNVVTAIVAPFESATLSSGSTTVRVSGPFGIDVRLSNDGNVTTTFFVNLALQTGAFIAKDAQVVLDLNGNGIADVGEPVVTPTTPLTIPANGAVSLVVVATLPDNVAKGATGAVNLTAASQDQTVTRSIVANLIVGGTAQVSVSISAMPAVPVQDSDVTVALSATSLDTPLAGSAATVDGVATTLVLLRDPIPPSTQVTALTPAGGAIALYHHRGDPDGSYATTLGSPATVDGVAFAAATLAQGQTLAGSVTLYVAGSAVGPIGDTAALTFNDQGNDRSVSSNALSWALPKLAATLGIFGTSDYVRPIPSFKPGALLYLQLTAPACDVDPNAIEVEHVTLQTKLAGDSQVATLVETGPDTGVFRTTTPIRTASTQSAANGLQTGLLVVANDDTISATPSGCAAGASITSMPVDPAGVIFDSRTNAPIAGATVALIDVSGSANGGKPGTPAVVFGADGVSSAPSTVTTGSDGRYAFPLVGPSTYRLVLTAPEGYVGPSRVSPGALPAGHDIDAQGSYGGNFIVAGDLVLIDIPLDVQPISGLFVEISASKSIADIGDFVDYRITVRNTAAVAINNVVLHDRLPRGFAYQTGTTRIDGVRASDPNGTSAVDLALGNLAPAQSTAVTYRMKVGPGARGGDGVDHALATAGPSQSNDASVKVLLSDGGVFSDRGYLIGKVYADCNRNGVQDAGEPGIPDVRIVLEDGTSATTDEDGKYSLYGLIPRTHVAKVDATTLVGDTSLEVLGNRNAGDGNSRFVDLKDGELQRADFAVVGCGPALDAAIAARRSRVSRVGEVEAASKALLTATTATGIDARTLPASGVLDAKGIVVGRGPHADAAPSTSDISDVDDRAAATRLHAAVQSGDAIDDGTRASTVDDAIARRDGVATRRSLGDLLPSLPTGLGFIDLDDDAVMPTTQATIRVRGPADVAWSLSVDGVAVDERHVGERSVLASRNLAAIEYVGVPLVAGTNRLELVARDAFGNPRERVALRVRVAGAAARIKLDVPAEIKADGRSIVKLRVQVVDANGLPVVGRVPVTLDTTAGRLLNKDLDPREPGTQVVVEGGTLDVELLAPVDAGHGLLRAQAGPLRTEAPLLFVPDLRPLLAVGLVEGVLNLRSLGSNSIVGSSGGDTFEREIRNVTRQFDDGRASAEARAALYLKGKVLGSTLLTLAYDSDKPQRERLFRDIQPDQFYPIYGDSSVKGFDAQSTSRLYVRVDRGASYVLYGDYTTQTEDPARSLTQYNRALTGAKGRVEEGPLRVDGFAAYTSSQQVVDELPGNGTSGPFVLSRANGLVNSEQVHILTRDRNQPAIVISDVPMTRFADYEIEALTGRLLFKLPIPSVDADLNPVSIRISYEVDDGGPSFWVGGVDAKLAVTDHATVGGVYIRDTDPSDRSTLRGVNATVKITEHAVVVGEFAESDSDLHGLGRGRRVEYKQEDENLQARLYGGKTDVNFFNPNALLAQGRAEYGGKLGLRLDPRDRLTIEGIRSEDPVSGARRTGVLARVERSLANDVKVEVGLRRVDETLAPASLNGIGGASSNVPNDFTSVRAKVTVPVPFVVGANVFGEYERAIGAGDRQVAAIGGTYALPQGGRLYARHEFISSLSGAYDLNSTQRLTTTVVGVDADYMKDGHLFNEYRVGDAIDGRSSEAAIGLRNLWRIADGVNVTTTAENIKPIGGPVNDRSNALTGAVDYTASPNWKGSARAEYRNATASDSWLVTTGGAFKLSDSTTLLGRAIYSDLANAAAESGARRIARAQFGGAYRPVDSNVWNALARIEVKREQDSTAATAPIDEIATIASAHVNVMPTADLSFNARYGIKRATDRSNGFDSHSTTQLLGGRAIKDINDKWDVGVNAFILASDGLRSRSYAVGAEAGYRVATNLWVSTGYNVSGFQEKDLAGEDYTQRGAYLRMRYKFDENVFGAAKGDPP